MWLGITMLAETIILLINVEDIIMIGTDAYEKKHISKHICV